MASDISWFKLLMEVSGGLALFLLGIEMMSQGMKKYAGARMRTFLAAVTTNRFIGLLAGAVLTVIVQSSSAATVMMVSFVQAQLMTLSQTLVISLGAGIGTSITVQLVAFNITDYALWAVAIGFGIQLFSKVDEYKNLALGILGFGLLFYGMNIMGDAMIPLRGYQPFINQLNHFQNPFISLLVGTIFTSIIQSSAAFIGIIIVLAQQQMLTLDMGIPLMMGANIGTCFTAVLASIGTERKAKRVAVAHILFRIFGVAIFFPFLAQFSWLIGYLSNIFHLEIARQIAHAHTIFNVVMALAALPFLGPFAKLIYLLLPRLENELDDSATITSPPTTTDHRMIPSVRNLNEDLISVPSLAIPLVRAEIYQMVKLMSRMVQYCIIPFLQKDIPRDKKYPQLSLIEALSLREKKIDFIEENVNRYLIKVSQQNLSEKESNEIVALFSIVKDIECIADIIDKNIIPLSAKKNVLLLDFSTEGKEEIQTFHSKICKQIARIQEAFLELDPEKGLTALTKMEHYLNLEAEYRMKHLKRMGQLRKESLETHSIHMDLMDFMKQINIYTGSIGKTINQMTQLSRYGNIRKQEQPEQT